MTKAAALHTWFNRFLTAYPASSVPDDADFPWLTYELVTGAWDSGETAITVNLWYYTESEAVPNAKAQEISNTIGRGGLLLACDGGAIWLKRGSPFAQSIRDDTDDKIKRRYINITAEFLTAD